MSLYKSLSVSLHGAMMLARGQARGILLMNFDARGIARSFWAIPMALPSVLYLATLEWPHGSPSPHALLDLVRQGLIFVLGWLAFAALTHLIAPRLNRAHLWVPMIVAWSWCNVPEAMLMVLGTIPGTLGAPPIVDQAAQVATFGWALWIEWFALRLAFGAGPLLAVWLVMVDQSIGLLLVVLDKLPTGG